MKQERHNDNIGGSSSVGRASAFQAGRRGFETRLPLSGGTAHVAQLAEHVLGKDEVTRSIRVVGSTREPGGGRQVGAQAKK